MVLGVGGLERPRLNWVRRLRVQCRHHVPLLTVGHMLVRGVAVVLTSTIVRDARRKGY